MPYKMVRAFFCTLCSVFLCLGINASAQSDPTSAITNADNCHGEFLNPISDVCWECLAPITIGPIEIFPSGKHDFGNPSIPFCICGIVPGIPIGYWEPRRLMDMTKTPYCFANLGGLKLDPGIGQDTGSKANRRGGQSLDKWHAHYYIYPVLSLLNLITDVLCADAPGFDIGYVTELDPTWNSDSLSVILHPESIIFSNPIAIHACTIDCAQTLVDGPNEDMFWCNGCSDHAYPFNGNIVDEENLSKGALTVAQRLSFKLHRQLIAFSTAGKDNLCHKAPEPLMDKRQYRYQLTQPKAITSGSFTCPSLGFPTTPYDRGGVTRPITREDFGILLWGKRNCCAL